MLEEDLAILVVEMKNRGWKQGFIVELEKEKCLKTKKSMKEKTFKSW